MRVGKLPGWAVIFDLCAELLKLPYIGTVEENELFYYLWPQLVMNLKVRKTDDFRLGLDSTRGLCVQILAVCNRHLAVWPLEVISFVRFQLTHGKQAIDGDEFTHFILANAGEFNKSEGGHWIHERQRAYEPCLCGCGGHLFWDETRVYTLVDAGVVLDADPRRIMAEMHGDVYCDPNVPWHCLTPSRFIQSSLRQH